MNQPPPAETVNNTIMPPKHSFKLQDCPRDVKQLIWGFVGWQELVHPFVTTFTSKAYPPQVIIQDMGFPYSSPCSLDYFAARAYAFRSCFVFTIKAKKQQRRRLKKYLIPSLS